MKKRYIKPQIEVYSYRPERGYASSVALHRDYRDQRDYVLIEGTDRGTLRASEEVTEYTERNAKGDYEFTTGLWDF